MTSTRDGTTLIGKDVKDLKADGPDDEAIRKIRRRCEDVLRKSDQNTILKVAHMLGVKTI
jgi:hypothetical protein